MTDPSVQAAQARRRKANSEYHEALRRAMLRADPGLSLLNGGNPDEEIKR